MICHANANWSTNARASLAVEMDVWLKLKMHEIITNATNEFVGFELAILRHKIVEAIIAFDAAYASATMCGSFIAFPPSIISPEYLIRSVQVSNSCLHPRHRRPTRSCDCGQSVLGHE